MEGGSLPCVAGRALRVCDFPQVFWGPREKTWGGSGPPLKNIIPTLSTLSAYFSHIIHHITLHCSESPGVTAPVHPGASGAILRKKPGANRPPPPTPPLPQGPAQILLHIIYVYINICYCSESPGHSPPALGRCIPGPPWSPPAPWGRLNVIKSTPSPAPADRPRR